MTIAGWAAVLTTAALGASAMVVAFQAPSITARLTRVDGLVYVNERAVTAPNARDALPETTLLRTADGRALVSLKVGGTLAMSARTSVRIHANGVYNFNRIEVLGGSVIVASGESSPAVHCPESAMVAGDPRLSGSEVRLSSRGIYRFDIVAGASPERCRLRVFDGAAAVAATSVLRALRPGQSLELPSGDFAPQLGFDTTDLDAFGRWARAQKP